MRIGKVELESNILLAPMAGVTDKAFRMIVKPFGPALMYTEMVSGKGLFYKSKKTADLLTADESEKPVAVQIFGHDADIMAEIANSALEYGAAVIDINMGCPAPKIVNNGDGCALMKSPETAAKVISAVCRAVDVPVTVKFRAGWDDKSINAVEFAKIAEQSGASAVTVHGRTREQFYSGTADLDIIKAVKAAVKIPVIGNGDITDGASAKNMLDKTGCDSIMVGRGALGNPFIFQIIKKTLVGETYSEPTLFERQRAMQRHIELMRETKPERVGVPEMRKHFAWYVKGLPHSAKLKVQAFSAKTYEELFDLVNEMK